MTSLQTVKPCILKTKFKKFKVIGIVGIIGCHQQMRAAQTHSLSLDSCMTNGSHIYKSYKHVTGLFSTFIFSSVSVKHRLCWPIDPLCGGAHRAFLFLELFLVCPTLIEQKLTERAEVDTKPLICILFATFQCQWRSPSWPKKNTVWVKSDASRLNMG